MNQNILVSVIIPVYNAKKYIKECLDSILIQTYKNIEIIVVDDGSTDGSMDVVKKYNDKRIHIIQKENGGVSSARNIGLANMRGDVVLNVDADDYISPTMIEKMVKTMMQYDVDLVSCQYYLVENGKLKKGIDSDSISSRVINSEEAIELGLERKELSTIACTKLYKKEILWQNMYPVGVNFEDNYVFNRVISHCKSIYLLAEYLYYYRIVDTSITNLPSLKRVKDAIYVHKYVYEEICRDYPQYKEKAKRLYVQKLYNNYCILRKKCDEKDNSDYNEVKQQIINELNLFKYDKTILSSMNSILNTHPKIRYMIGSFASKIKK